MKRGAVAAGKPSSKVGQAPLHSENGLLVDCGLAKGTKLHCSMDERATRFELNPRVRFRAAFQVVLKRRPDFLSMASTSVQDSAGFVGFA
jgi:hypothetical protein